MHWMQKNMAVGCDISHNSSHIANGTLNVISTVYKQIWLKFNFMELKIESESRVNLWPQLLHSYFWRGTFVWVTPSLWTLVLPHDGQHAFLPSFMASSSMVLAPNFSLFIRWFTATWSKANSEFDKEKTNSEIEFLLYI